MKVLKIGAVWCNGCLVMKPRWKEIEAEHPWLQTEYFEFDESPELVNKYQIVSETLPVFIFLDQHNQELLRLSGEVDKAVLVQTIKANRDK